MKYTESLTVKKLYKLVIDKLIHKLIWIHDKRNPRGGDRIAGRVNEQTAGYNTIEKNTIQILFSGLTFYIHRVDIKRSEVDITEYQFKSTPLYEIRRYE